MKMQMPPTRSISRASTVAKIGRPMKKLTMAVLPTLALALACGSSSIGDARPGAARRARGSGLPARPRGFAFLGPALLRSRALLGLALLGSRALPGRARHVGRGRHGLDGHPGPD